MNNNNNNNNNTNNNNNNNNKNNNNAYVPASTTRNIRLIFEEEGTHEASDQDKRAPIYDDISIWVHVLGSSNVSSMMGVNRWRSELGCLAEMPHLSLKNS